MNADVSRKRRYISLYLAQTNLLLVLVRLTKTRLYNVFTFFPLIRHQ